MKTMIRPKRGNAFTHAKTGGVKVRVKRAVVKKPAVKKARVVKKALPKKRAVVRKIVRAKPAAPAFKYRLQIKRSSKGIWQTIAGMNNLTSIKQLAKAYAKNYPRFAFQVV